MIRDPLPISSMSQSKYLSNILVIFLFETKCNTSARKKINRIRSLVNPIRSSRNAFSFGSQDDEDSKLIQLESKEITIFLSSIYSAFNLGHIDETNSVKVDTKPDSSLSLHFLQEIRLLLVFLGRITSVDEVIVREGSRDSASPSGQFICLLLMTWKESIRISFLAWDEVSISCPAASMDLSFCSSVEDTGTSSTGLMSSMMITNPGSNLMSSASGNQMSSSVGSLMTSFPLEVTAIFLSDLMTVSLMRFDSGRLIAMLMIPSKDGLSDKEWSHLSPFPSPIFSSCLKSVRDALVLSSLRNHSLPLPSCSSFWSLFTSLCLSREELKKSQMHSIFNVGPLFPIKGDASSRSTAGTMIQDDVLMSSLWFIYSFQREMHRQDKNTSLDNREGNSSVVEMIQKTDPFPSALTVDLVKKIVARDGVSMTGSTSSSSLTNITLTCCLSRLFLESHLIVGNTVDLIFPFLELIVKRLNHIDDLPASFTLPKNGHEWSSWISSGSIVGGGNSHHPGGRGLFASMLLLFESFVKNCIPGYNRKTSSTASSSTMMTTSLMEGDLLDKSSQVQRFKGRLYSKIQPKRLEDLSDVGLFKFLTIFLSFPSWTTDCSSSGSDASSLASSSSLSSVSSWMEMSDKVCEITQKILDRREHRVRDERGGVTSASGDGKNSSGGRTAVAIKSLFALLYLMPSPPSTSSSLESPSSIDDLCSPGENPFNSLSVSSCNSSKVKNLLIRQIPLLSTIDSRHPLAVSFIFSPLSSLLFPKVNKILFSRETTVTSFLR